MTRETKNTGSKHVDTQTYTRRKLLASGVAASAFGLAGCSGGGGSDSGDEGDESDSTAEPMDDSSGGEQTDRQTTAEPTQEAATDETGGCTPGHSDGSSPCQQIADDAGVLTGFNASGTGLLTTFDYPCGWQTSTSEQEDYVVANATRSGEDFGAYVDVQVRNYFDAVTPEFIQTKKESGNYDDVTYEYDGETRTGIVSSKSSAQFGTLAHAVVPFDGSLVHVELVSTLKADGCDIEPRPDYDVVVAMFESLDANPETTFSLA